MDWTTVFFGEVPNWWSRPQVATVDLARAATVARLAGPPPLRVLELGSGGGATAVATARAGYEVVAIDSNKTQVDLAEDLARGAPEVGRRLAILHEDFYTMVLARPADCVAYWNGFGIGSDADQRQLLRRVREHFLTSTGCVILDINNPTGRAVNAGRTFRVSYECPLAHYIDYDPIHSIWMDRWWPVDEPEKAITQYHRCYSPADLILLLEGTGLSLDQIEINGTVVDSSQPQNSRSLLWNAKKYQVKLVCC